MPKGSAVVVYDGKRGRVFRVKYADAEGRQVMETLGPEREGWTRKKAEAELRERLVRVERGGYRRPGPLTFRDYAETWFSEGETRRGWKPSTVAEYRSTRRRLVETFGAMPLGAIRPRHIAEYIAEMARTFAPATVGRDVALLHAIFKTALREELVERNPAETAERPKLPPFRPQILEPVEVGRVARAFTDEQARVVFLTLVLTGLRRSELQRLRWADVDLVENILRVRDSKSEDGIRSIALSPTLAEELWQHRRRTAFQGDDERVFCHPDRGTVYRAETFKAALTAALEAAGVDKTPRPFHDLRHTAITNDAAAGSSPIAVMTKAGHANMTTTKRYLHLAGVVFRDEAEALEHRLLGAARPVESSTDLSVPDRISVDRNGLESRIPSPPVE
jgi:integrase